MFKRPREARTSQTVAKEVDQPIVSSCLGIICTEFKSTRLALRCSAGEQLTPVDDPHDCLRRLSLATSSEAIPSKDLAESSR